MSIIPKSKGKRWSRDGFHLLYGVVLLLPQQNTWTDAMNSHRDKSPKGLKIKKRR